MRPVERSIASATSLSPVIPVRKMRSFVRTGEDRPNGTSVRQTRFFFGPNSVGSPVDVETPDPLGPRNRDQSSSAAWTPEIRTKDTTRNFMGVGTPAWCYDDRFCECSALTD